MHDGSCLVDALLRFLKIWNNSYKYYIPVFSNLMNKSCLRNSASPTKPNVTFSIEI